MDRLHPRRSAILDSLLWFITCSMLLSIPLIGWVSGDAIAHSERFANGVWILNPNHLLFEPIGAWWQNFSKVLLEAFGIHRSDPDRLTLLSVFSGAVTLAIFRFGIAKLGATRFISNLATASVALSSAFGRMWISGEHFMIMMPFVAAMGLVALYHLKSGSSLSVAASALFGAIAILCMISNIFICAATIGFGVIVIFKRSGTYAAIRYCSVFSAICFGLAGLGLLAGWWVGDHSVPFSLWLTSYRGAGGAARDSIAYGFMAEPFMAAFRSVYGILSAALDLQMPVSFFRDHRIFSPADAVQFLGILLLGALFILLGWNLRQHWSVRELQAVLLISICWLLGTGIFGVIWNNSDDQFYFHLSVIFGFLTAAVGTYSRGRALTVLLLLVLAINGFDLFNRYVLFPRNDQIQKLDTALNNTGLVIIPGGNSASMMVWFTNDEIKNRRIDLIDLSGRDAPAEGLEQLSRIIRETLQAHRRVDVLEVFDTPARAVPWKYLELQGYKKEELINLLLEFPVDKASKMVAGYTLRSIYPVDISPETSRQALLRETQIANK